MNKNIIEVTHGNSIGSFYVRDNTLDNFIVNSIWKNNEYFYREINIEPGNVVVDIGCHVGAFSILAAKKGASKVLSFEPLQENYNSFIDNIELNNVTDIVKPFNKAVYYSNNDVFINHGTVSGNETGSSFLSNSREIKVETITLNNILKDLETCDFLKIDCEGSEYNILKNSDLSKVKKISMEVHKRDRNNEIITHLFDRGFELVHFAQTKTLGILKAMKVGYTK